MTRAGRSTRILVHHLLLNPIRRCLGADLHVHQQWGDILEIREHAVPSPDSLALVGLRARRYLDHHLIIFDPQQPLTRSMAELCLFDDIAETYEKEIDIERNVDNYRTLLSLVEIHSSPEALTRPLLDFGCGSGTVVLANPSREIWGYDSSPNMRKAARRRGLKTLSTAELHRCEPTRFGGIIASYVMHLALDSALFAEVRRLSMQSGAIAANFHKGWGFEQARQNLENSSRADNLTLVDYHFRHRHGPTAAWKRITQRDRQ